MTYDTFATRGVITGAAGSLSIGQVPTQAYEAGEVDSVDTSANLYAQEWTAWTEWTCPSGWVAGKPIAFTTKGSTLSVGMGGGANVDTVITVYSGGPAVSGLTQVAFNDDENPVIDGNANSTIGFIPVASTTYYIRLGVWPQAESPVYKLVWGGAYFSDNFRRITDPDTVLGGPDVNHGYQSGGVAWVVQQGAFHTASGQVTTDTATAGTPAIATFDVKQPNGLLELDFNDFPVTARGTVIRFVDVDNYMWFNHDDAVMYEVIGGVQTAQPGPAYNATMTSYGLAFAVYGDFVQVRFSLGGGGRRYRIPSALAGSTKFGFLTTTATLFDERPEGVSFDALNEVEVLPEIPGDLFDNAITVNLEAGSYSDPSWSGSVFMGPVSGLTLEAGEPATSNAGVVGTKWFKFVADASWPGYLTLVPSDDDPFTHATAYAGVAVSGLVPVSGLTELFFTQYVSGAVSGVALDGNVPPVEFYVRYEQLNDDVATSAWTYRLRIPEVTFTISNELAQTPGSLIVNISNLEPESVVVFSASGHASFFSVTADTTGSVFNVSVPIEWSLAAGTYTLSAGTTYGVVTQDFNVLADADMRPDIPSPITAPAAPAPAVVNKWRVTDPYTDAVYVFPWNPSSASTPHPAKPFTFATTTAPDGQVLTWEGAPNPVSWTVGGFIDTEAFYEKLEFLVNSNKRYWVTDHRLRRWYVSFESFDPTVKKNPANPNWCFDYELHMNIYLGPVS